MILILCPVGVLIALVFDDWRTSTGLGAGLFLALAFTTGTPSSPAKYTELAFLGPVQYFRAVAASLAGVEFPSALEMVNRNVDLIKELFFHVFPIFFPCYETGVVY